MLLIHWVNEVAQASLPAAKRQERMPVLTMLYDLKPFDLGVT